MLVNKWLNFRVLKQIVPRKLIIYIYIKDNKIIVKVEAPGNNNIKTGLEISDEYNIIKSK